MTLRELRKRMWILRKALIGSLCLLLCGCVGGVTAKSIGAGPWPVYDEPRAEAFTAEETAQLEAWKKQNRALFNKIQGLEHAYRAIVRGHNEAALKHNRALLKAAGFEDAAEAAKLTE